MSATQLVGGLLKMLKFFEVTLNTFQYSHVTEIGESWLVSENKFSWIMFIDRDNKTKLAPAFFFLTF